MKYNELVSLLRDKPKFEGHVLEYVEEVNVEENQDATSYTTKVVTRKAEVKSFRVTGSSHKGIEEELAHQINDYIKEKNHIVVRSMPTIKREEYPLNEWLYIGRARLVAY
ncbi:hypothetical protein D3C81_173860 [compost metagenome]